MSRRSISLPLCIAVGLALACAFSRGAAAGPEKGRLHVNPRPLWSAFPLDQRRRSPRRATVQKSPRHDNAASSGTNLLWPALAGASMLVLVGGGAVLRQRRRAPAAVTPPRADDLPMEPVPRLEGGPGMAGSARKRWFGGGELDPDASPIDEASGSADASTRIFRYTTNEAAAPPADLSSPQAEAESPTERSAGEEVDTILRTAREAAAKLVRTATADAEQLRAEAREAAEREREQAAALRSEADAYAQRTRNEADAAAEQLRSEAEREAAAIVESARVRLDAADVEIAAKLERSEESARERVHLLETQVSHHEERVAQLLRVFHGMTAQLEQLVGSGRADDQAVQTQEQLDEALQPDRPSERVV